jgi:NarL family two-component system sensor histidine kinase LiaS
MAGQLRELLETRQALAAVEERNRLARDLHDAAKQQLFAISLQLGAARSRLSSDPGQAERHLAEAEELAGQVRQELTALIGALRPPALDGQGLAAAVRAHAAAWTRQTGLTADVRVRGERPSPLPVEQALFRVAQEALANVARHAQAQTVDVQLAWDQAPSRVRLIVADDGRGFDPAATNGSGYGLRSMRERLVPLGGGLEVRSAPGQGTVLEAWVPEDA